MDEISDVDYIPRYIDDTHLFDLKKRFVWIVFIITLITNKGKSLVKKHERDYNTHVINTELLAHMLISTKASVVSFTILTYITTAKFGNGPWNGSSESFILHPSLSKASYWIW